MSDNIVILAGGISSRMRKSMEDTSVSIKKKPLDSSKFSKTMIKVGDQKKPFLDYLLKNVINSGYNDVVIVINNRDAIIRNYYDQTEDFKCLNISYAVQEIPKSRKKPLGTADALSQALIVKHEWAGQKFTVCNSDNLYSEYALNMINTNQFPNAMIDYDQSALDYPRERIQSFALLLKDKQGYLTDIIEKPSSNFFLQLQKKYGRIGVSMNLFRFDYDMIFPVLEKVPINPERKEKEIPDAVKILIEEYPGSVFTIPISEHVPDLTEQSDITKMENYLNK